MSVDPVVEEKIEILQRAIHDLASVLSAISNFPPMKPDEQTRLIKDLMSKYKSVRDAEIARLRHPNQAFNETEVKELEEFSKSLKGE